MAVLISTTAASLSAAACATKARMTLKLPLTLTSKLGTARRFSFILSERAPLQPTRAMLEAPDFANASAIYAVADDDAVFAPGRNLRRLGYSYGRVRRKMGYHGPQ